MEIKVLASDEAVAREGAAIIAAEARAAVAARGHFMLGVSGGKKELVSQLRAAR